MYEGQFSVVAVSAAEAVVVEICLKFYQFNHHGIMIKDPSPGVSADPTNQCPFPWLSTAGEKTTVPTLLLATWVFKQ